MAGILESETKAWWKLYLAHTFSHLNWPFFLYTLKLLQRIQEPTVYFFVSISARVQKVEARLYDPLMNHKRRSALQKRYLVWHKFRLVTENLKQTAAERSWFYPEHWQNRLFVDTCVLYFDMAYHMALVNAL